MNLMPKNLFNRFLLIIVTPIIILQLITTIIFYERHWQSVSYRIRANLINDISAIINLVNDNELEKAQQIASLFALDLVIHKHDTLENHSVSPIITDSDLKQFSKLLQYQLTIPHEATYTESHSKIKVLIQLDKSILDMTFSHKRIQSPTTFIFLIWIIASALLMLTIAVTFMKNQVRSILQLANAAERFGKGLETPKFKPSGATEVKNAGWAFIRMKRRIKRQIEYRTELLTHISHDLRTPLTRIKLSLEMHEHTKNDEALKTDIREMENLIRSYLDFAKEEGNESSELVNFIPYVVDIAKSIRNKKLKICVHCNEVSVYLKPEAFKRALYNIIDNALKHCEDRVKLSIKVINHHLNIVIEDDGKGIDKKNWRNVFKPFFKTNKDSEGYGLGLAIAKSIVYNNGGQIKLKKSNLGGLKAIIKIPV